MADEELNDKQKLYEHLLSEENQLQIDQMVADFAHAAIRAMKGDTPENTSPDPMTVEQTLKRLMGQIDIALNESSDDSLVQARAKEFSDKIFKALAESQEMAEFYREVVAVHYMKMPPNTEFQLPDHTGLPQALTSLEELSKLEGPSDAHMKLRDALSLVKEKQDFEEVRAYLIDCKRSSQNLSEFDEKIRDYLQRDDAKKMERFFNYIGTDSTKFLERVQEVIDMELDEHYNLAEEPATFLPDGATDEARFSLNEFMGDVVKKDLASKIKLRNQNQPLEELYLTTDNDAQNEIDIRTLARLLADPYLRDDPERALSLMTSLINEHGGEIYVVVSMLDTAAEYMHNAAPEESRLLVQENALVLLGGILDYEPECFSNKHPNFKSINESIVRAFIQKPYMSEMEVAAAAIVSSVVESAEDNYSPTPPAPTSSSPDIDLEDFIKNHLRYDKSEKEGISEEKRSKHQKNRAHVISHLTQDLSSMFKEAYLQIQSIEVYGSNLEDENIAQHAAQISNMADGLKEMILTDILFNAKDKKHQIEIYKFYTDLIKHCIDENELTIGYMILASLVDPSVSRLTYLNESLSEEMQAYIKTQEMKAGGSDPKEYRESLDEPGVLPMLAFEGKDIVGISEGNEKKVSHHHYTIDEHGDVQRHKVKSYNLDRMEMLGAKSRMLTEKRDEIASEFTYSKDTTLANRVVVKSRGDKYFIDTFESRSKQIKPRGSNEVNVNAFNPQNYQLPQGSSSQSTNAFETYSTRYRMLDSQEMSLNDKHKNKAKVLEGFLSVLNYTASFTSKDLDGVVSVMHSIEPSLQMGKPNKVAHPHRYREYMAAKKIKQTIDVALLQKLAAFQQAYSHVGTLKDGTQILSLDNMLNSIFASDTMAERNLEGLSQIIAEFTHHVDSSDRIVSALCHANLKAIEDGIEAYALSHDLTDNPAKYMSVKLVQDKLFNQHAHGERHAELVEDLIQADFDTMLTSVLNKDDKAQDHYEQLCSLSARLSDSLNHPDPNVRKAMSSCAKSFLEVVDDFVEKHENNIDLQDELHLDLLKYPIMEKMDYSQESDFEYVERIDNSLSEIPSVSSGMMVDMVMREVIVSNSELSRQVLSDMIVKNIHYSESDDPKVREIAIENLDLFNEAFRRIAETESSAQVEALLTMLHKQTYTQLNKLDKQASANQQEQVLSESAQVAANNEMASAPVELASLADMDEGMQIQGTQYNQMVKRIANNKENLEIHSITEQEKGTQIDFEGGGACFVEKAEVTRGVGCNVKLDFNSSLFEQTMRKSATMAVESLSPGSTLTVRVDENHPHYAMIRQCLEEAVSASNKNIQVLDHDQRAHKQVVGSQELTAMRKGDTFTEMRETNKAESLVEIEPSTKLTPKNS